MRLLRARSRFLSKLSPLETALAGNNRPLHKLQQQLQQWKLLLQNRPRHQLQRQLLLWKQRLLQNRPLRQLKQQQKRWKQLLLKNRPLHQLQRQLLLWTQRLLQMLHWYQTGVLSVYNAAMREMALLFAVQVNAATL